MIRRAIGKLIGLILEIKESFSKCSTTQKLFVESGRLTDANKAESQEMNQKNASSFRNMGNLQMTVTMNTVGYNAQTSRQNSNAPNKNKKLNALIGEDNMQLYTKDELHDQKTVRWATKIPQDNKRSAALHRRREMIQPNSNVSAVDIGVLLAEEFFKIQTNFKNKFSSDFIDIVKISANKIFTEKRKRKNYTIVSKVPI